MENLIKFIIYLLITLIKMSYPLKSMSQEQKNNPKRNVTVHIITKL